MDPQVPSVTVEMNGMKSDAGNAPLRLFRRVVLSVADDRVADGGKLHPDLVLQSRDQRNADERCSAKPAFHGIPEFRARRLGITRRG